MLVPSRVKFAYLDVEHEFVNELAIDFLKRDFHSRKEDIYLIIKSFWEVFRGRYGEV